MDHAGDPIRRGVYFIRTDKPCRSLENMVQYSGLLWFKVPDSGQESRIDAIPERETLVVAV